MSSAEAIKLIHVAFAMVSVGGAIGFEILGHRAVKRVEPAGMVAFARDTDFLGKVFGLTSLVALGFGIWAVVDRSYISFGDTWVWLSLTITVYLILMGPLYFGPTAGRMIADGEAKGGDHPDVVARARQLLRIAHLDTVARFIVVYLMVARSGA